ncbi:hypothetical protein A2926_00450 [Candidatus Giovannonibacteria bacterium RIFCSPLOWO2_01_FULL_44_40]|uniref:DUF5673 domain-containing protein n=1 Tax=Candidatus Giovannonibacteria bacterium RIFCSPHIGHO2_01_FULL_45_23 TaxID=1798325 RepID=A0A1F5VFB5_9BACT|nr:MAG: hypothetical protein A2834_00465 [Candidatus Giovannonibacteria bacterium RIFCSPHIGHO2_01_FULL_45_23]OGF76517.1 MAG: hypothetical protein A3C77_03170 [Candidatus Giovannonibacteria bacterium RIFCSPHIGHO2_02_FULL_45_13]OGF79783.1 MAG: hypothetical protein A2926_00450 [Candidatus Giovannonibacteria bacterium RIFCSPLOWO2_01_FULL_44_40]
MDPKEDQAGKVFLSWEAHEYFHHEKGTDWYWWTGLAAIILLGFAIYQKSFLFGVLVLVGWFTVVLYAVRPPRTLKFSLTERGVLVERTLYSWQSLKSFWIFYNPPLHKDLSLESKKALVPFIKIPLGQTEPDKVREIVIKFLPEIEQEESLIDNLSHLARF